MSAYTGKQGKGAAKKDKETKRIEAEVRNEATPVERTKKYRNATPEEKLLLDVYRQQ